MQDQGWKRGVSVDIRSSFVLGEEFHCENRLNQAINCVGEHIFRPLRTLKEAKKCDTKVGKQKMVLSVDGTSPAIEIT
jgi:hypothetical protein